MAEVARMLSKFYFCPTGHFPRLDLQYIDFFSIRNFSIKNVLKDDLLINLSFVHVHINLMCSLIVTDKSIHCSKK